MAGTVLKSSSPVQWLGRQGGRHPGAGQPSLPPVDEHLAGARRSLLVEFEVDAGVVDVGQDERLGRRRRDPVGAGQRLVGEHSVEELDASAATGDRPHGRDQPADELPGESARPAVDDEERPLALGGRG
jgi:hypothetical protein